VGLISQRSLRRLTRRLWAVIFTSVIAVAVLVQLGREAFPLLNEYRSDISQIIGKRLGVHITIGELSAKWKGLRPEVSLNTVAVESLNGDPIFDIENVTAELSLVDSVARGSVQWRRLTFQKLHTTFAQQDSGRWGIKYLTGGNANRKFSIEDPLDIFLFGRRVELDGVNLKLEFRTGHESILRIPRITLENDRDFHRATASAGVLDKETDEEEHFQFVVEATGDPRDADNFHAEGYLQLASFPMEKVVAAFAGGFWQQQEEQRWGEGHRLDLKLWFNGSSAKGMKLQGELRSDGLPLDVPDPITLPNKLTADITGDWHPHEGWSFIFQDIAVLWPTFSAPPLNVRVSGGMGTPLHFGVDYLDVEAWHRMAKMAGFTQGKAANVLDTLAPRGILRNVDIALADKDNGYFRLKADVDDAGVEAIAGSPKISGVSGFVSASATDGYVEIDSKEDFSLFFPKLYDQPMKYDAASGRVAWKLDQERRLVYVMSSQLRLVSGEERANGYLRLKLPTRRDGREPYMTLAVGMDKAPVSLHRKYVPKLIPRALSSWLGRSVGEGEAHDIAFIFNGSLSKHAEVSPNIQLLAKVSKGDLAFDPQWPALKNIDGTLRLDNRTLDVQIDRATLLNNTVNNAEVLLVRNPVDEGRALSITGALKSNAAAAMNLLQESPVRNLFGDTFDSWTFGGNVSARIALLIPLSADAEGLRQSVDVDFDKARVDMRDIDLAINRVSGRLHYDSDSGLSASALKGQVWGKPLKASISSPLSASGKERDTLIAFSGPMEIADLRQWTRRPELGFASGGAAVNGQIRIPAKLTEDYFLEVTIDSTLQGVSFDLPAPLHKDKGQIVEYSSTLHLYQGMQKYLFQIGKHIQLRLQAGERIETSGQISVGADPLPLQPGFFDVVGRVDTFDLMVWDTVREQYFAFRDEDRTEGKSGQDSDLPIRLNLDIGEARLGDATLQALHVDGLGTESQWELRVENAMTSGVITVSENDDSIDLAMNLDYLRLVSAEIESAIALSEEPVKSELEPAIEQPVAESDSLESGMPQTSDVQRSRMANIDLSKLTFPVSFSVENLSFDGKPYGRWAFKMTPLDTGDGISVTDIHANVRGMLIGEAVVDSRGSESASPRPVRSGRDAFTQSAFANPRAQFVWRQTPAGNQSYFNGTLMANDIGAALEAWGFEKVLDCRRGIVDAEVTWMGAPDEITLPTVQGKVVFDLEDGNFIRGAAEADSGLLRLIALFNFDTIARRLKLDFSDLAKEGFGFESVHGEFDFKDGDIFINQPLVVDSTSSKIQLAGTLDVVNEMIDAELVATLPVAGDITVAAALVAGLPAAVGVFLVSKMFEEQVDRASSITYSVNGEWADPKIKFRRIFSDSGAAEKGLEVRKRARTVTAEDLQGIDFSDPPPPTPIPE